MELLLILIIALIIFGPSRLPEIGAALGRSIREFRQMSQELTTELSKELQAAAEAAKERERAEEEKAEAQKTEAEKAEEGEDDATGSVPAG
ncbi:MAG TPA: twin-arginine translocase TatA/TatE family subunit [Anaerolineae bacterium]|nr:twin-arginine translocase TatA/TatE family subunit [Anaerolineae bacterium]